MDDTPKFVGQKKNDKDCPQSMGNAPQKRILTTPTAQHLSQFGNSKNNSVGPSETADSPEEYSYSAQQSQREIDQLADQLKALDIGRYIGSCELKSEEIISLLAEKLPSSEREDNYGTFATKSLETEVTLMENAAASTVKYLASNQRLHSETLHEEFDDNSEDSPINSGRELLISLEDESDTKEMGDIKGTINYMKHDNEKEDSVSSDLINLNVSQEQFLESFPDQTTLTKKSLLDMLDEVLHSQNVLADENLINSKCDPQNNQTAETKQKMAVIMEPISIDINNRNFLDCKADKIKVEKNRDSNKEAEAIARAYIEQVKDTLYLNIGFKTGSDTTESRNGLKTLEEELRIDVESNIHKRKAARVLAEIGFPKKHVSELMKVKRDKTDMKKMNEIKFHWESNNESDHQLQNVISDELKKPVHSADSKQYIDVVAIEDSSSLNINENVSNGIAAEIENKDSTEANNRTDCLKDEKILGKLVDNALRETEPEIKEESKDSVRTQKSPPMNTMLKKKHVTFSDRKAEPGMEHMALHQKESSKIEESQQDLETTLLFLTESYPSHEDDEMLSESLSVTLEPSALAPRRRGSPRIRRRSEDPQKLYEELKTLEDDEKSKVPSISTCQSPDLPEIADSFTKDTKNSTKKQSKFSKFFKTVKKKIFS